MGRLIDYSFKNEFIISEENPDLLYVIMKGKKLNAETFGTESRRPKIENISITAGELTQQDFNELVSIIARKTNKPTIISFMPIQKENEDIADTHKRYAYNYTNSDPKNIKHFPSNVFINNSIMEEEDTKAKRNHM